MLMNRVCNSCVWDVHKFEIGIDVWILSFRRHSFAGNGKSNNMSCFYMSCATDSVTSSIPVASLFCCMKGAILMVPEVDG